MNDCINCVIQRKDLPERLKRILDSRGNVFYSERYYQVQVNKKYKPIYLYDDEYLIMVVLCREFLIFYVASLPVEYISLREHHRESEKEFLNKMVTYLRNVERVHWIGPTSTSAFFMAYPDGSEWIPFGSHVVDLQQSEETLWNNVHSKHRNVIRRAEKEGLNIISGNSRKLLEDFAYVDKITWARSGQKGHSVSFFEELVESYKDQIIIFAIYKQDKIQGAILLHYNDQMSYYLYGGCINDVQLGAMNYLHWHAMLALKNRGVKKYSFLGCRINEDIDSKYHTLQRFKSRFGGELVSGYMFKIPCNYFMYRLERRLRYIKRNHGKQCPLDIIDEERYKWV